MDILGTISFVIAMLLTNSYCINISKPLLADKRLIGGQTITKNTSMFVKLVSKDGRKEINCGGTVIHPEYVLTHARCVTGAEVVHAFISNVGTGDEIVKRSLRTFPEVKDEENVKLTLRDLELSDDINRYARNLRRSRFQSNRNRHNRGMRGSNVVFRHQINPGFVVYEIELSAKDDIFPSIRYVSITDLVLLKIPKNYTQDIAPICSPENDRFPQPLIGSHIGLIGFGAQTSGSMMHGFYGEWLSGNYATIERLVNGLILAGSKEVKSARGDMGGMAYLEDINGNKCIVGVIFEFDVRTNLTTIVNVEPKLKWIQSIMQPN